MARLPQVARIVRQAVTADTGTWEQLRSTTVQALEDCNLHYGLSTRPALVNHWIQQYRVRLGWLDIPMATPLLIHDDDPEQAR